ncbi:MAG TPA: protease modulator HflC [Xanthomonadales bacterium]|nr:protease modulator HflC [Xanthomonadales bacterium]
MRTTSIVVALAAALLLSMSVFVVNERELAVLFQFGAVQPREFQPGLHFKWPFLQNVRKFDRRILTLDSKPERYLTSEKKDVSVDFFVKWRIANVTKFYTTTQGDEGTANARLTPIVRQALGKAFNERTLRDVVSGARSDVADIILKATKGAVADLGIEIVDVRIKRIELPEEVSESVYRRMRAERTKVANELRSQGTEQSETIRAEADRARQVNIAEANRDAATLRGEGEAEAAGIYAKAYERDPEFYGFYRSLEAYRESFRNKDGVLVLDPDSEFFRYFGDGASR